MTVMFALSVDALTVGAAWIAGLAIVALALVGWRQPARPRPSSRRGSTDPRTGAPVPAGIAVERLPGEPYRPPNPLRRLAAAFASGGLAIVTGAVLAIVLSFAAAYAVVTVTGLLGR